jgi:hypothetical protein
MPGGLNRLCSALAAASLIAGASAPAAAATARVPAQVDPLVALSLFASPASQAALCGGAGAAAAAGSAVAAAQGAAPGCVLPVVDAPPPVAQSQPAPQALPPAQAAAIPVAAAAGFEALPLLLGLLAVAASAALLFDGNGDDDVIEIPNSPT